MSMDINIWGHTKYGSDPIKSVEIEPSYIRMYFADGATIYYPGDEEGIIDFKNKVLWAYEDYLRNKRSS